MVRGFETYLKGDDMRIMVVFALFALAVTGVVSVRAQDTLASGMTCYADILEDWKDQDKVTSTSGYRSAITAILPSLPEADRTLLQGRFDALGSASSTGTEMEKLYIRTCSARRAMRMTEYISKFQKVLFSEHPVLGGLYFFDAVPTAGGVSGKGLELLTMSGYYGSVSPLLPSGEARHPDVSFDGTRAIFSWRGGSSGSSVYHLYEMDLSTRTTRQLTSGNGEFNIDLDPCYLPNGDICFVSTRYAQEVDCIAGRVTNLMLCDKDGKYMRQIGFDQAPILYPRLMPDGKVSYCRWDYNDKAHTYAHAIFTMYPDGTHQREFCNNNSWWPTNILQQRSIPGSNGKVMAMIGGYHTVQWGKIGIIDVNVGYQNGKGVTLVAPVRTAKESTIDSWGSTSGGPYAWRKVDADSFPRPNAAPLDKWGQNTPLFAYPYPFDEKAFLVSYRPAFKESAWNGRMGLFFMTIDAGRELLFIDPNGACMGAIPAMPRPVPTKIANGVNYRDSMGTFQINKINDGLSVTGIANGVITRLRVAELYFRPGPIVDGGGSYSHCGAGDINYGGATYHTAIATENASWDAKWIVGETPVQSDGSANFRAPARAALFFQALNAKGQVVQTMRSWTVLQPGEIFSCHGCHESQLIATPNPPTPIAMQQPSLKLEQFYGPRRGFTFDKEIQPIFNAKCISCHNGSGGGGLDLRQGSAYNNLTKHATCDAFSKYVSWFNAEDSPVLQPSYRAGSCKSRLDTILDKGHKNVNVTDEDLRKIRCWIDLGVPRYGTYQEGHSGSEANLTYRNAWITQEKKNIADFLLTVATEPQDGPNGSAAYYTKSWSLTTVSAICRLGNIRIRLTVPPSADGQKVRINLYNTKGALVRTLLNKPLAAGYNELTFDVGVRAAGQYLVELRSRGVTKTMQVAILQ
jgi:hypothetical protein